jgi:hypothetical protein
MLCARTVKCVYLENTVPSVLELHVDSVLVAPPIVIVQEDTVNPLHGKLLPALQDPTSHKPLQPQLMESVLPVGLGTIVLEAQQQRSTVQQDGTAQLMHR